MKPNFLFFQYPAPLQITCNALLCPRAASLSRGPHLGRRTAMAFCQNMGSFIDPWSYGKVSYHPHFKVHSAYPHPMNSQCLKMTSKSRIQHCERSELRLHFEWKKFIKNGKNCRFGEFLKNATFWVIFEHCDHDQKSWVKNVLLSKKKMHEEVRKVKLA